MRGGGESVFLNSAGASSEYSVLYLSWGKKSNMEIPKV